MKPWDTVIIWGYAFQVAELWLFGVVSVVAWLWGVVVLWPIDRTKRDRPAQVRAAGIMVDAIGSVGYRVIGISRTADSIARFNRSDDAPVLSERIFLTAVLRFSRLTAVFVLLSLGLALPLPPSILFLVQINHVQSVLFIPHRFV